jgi:hypothetical protein
MVECCRIPVRRRVTLCAIVTEVPRHVVRVRCLLELRLMTTETFHGLRGKHIVSMTAGTLKWLMRTRQREMGQRCMIKSRSIPA